MEFDGTLFRTDLVGDLVEILTAKVITQFRFISDKNWAQSFGSYVWCFFII